MATTVEHLERWLLDKGFAELHSGYGHVDAKTLAEALIADRWVRDNPTPIMEEYSWTQE